MSQNILITGANGEIGHELIHKLKQDKLNNLVTLDISALDKELSELVDNEIEGDILDTSLLEKLFEKYRFDKVFHLAAMLSTSAEKDPVKAHHVNTDGSINLLALAEKFSRESQKKILFMFPSSIAAYGLPDVATSIKVGKIKENEWNKPATMYGCNKLYIELLGNYYERYYQKDADISSGFLDFRCLRFPGLLSATTLPTGGTSDFGPEIIHSAAKGEAYTCFVREDTKLPFMVMPDAVKALIDLSNVEKVQLKSHVYNVGSFSVSAKEIYELAKKEFNWDKITFKPDQKRQAIVDSWPVDVDDSAARADWGWSPEYDLKKAFKNYLIPAIAQRYSS